MSGKYEVHEGVNCKFIILQSSVWLGLGIGNFLVLLFFFSCFFRSFFLFSFFF